MKSRITTLGLVLAVGVLVLVGCGGDQGATSSAVESESAAEQAAPAQAESAPPPAPGGGQGSMGGEGFAEVSQLAIGSLYLQDTENAITPEQAAVLLPLWQQLKSVQESDPASEEISEIISQIEAAMTQEQLDAIAGVAQEDLMAWAQNQGMMPGPGAGGGPPENPGGGQPGTPGAEPPQMSEDQRATIEAGGGPQGQPTEGMPQGGRGTAMVDAVIAMLEALIEG